MKKEKIKLNKNACKVLSDMGRIRCIFSDKVIQVNKDTTTCTLICSIRLKDSIPYFILEWIESYPQFEYISLAQKSMTFRVSGTTIRAKEDKPNESIGRRFAESKAKRKVYRFCTTLFKKLAQYHYAKGAVYNQFWSTHLGYMATEIEYQQKLMKES